LVRLLKEGGRLPVRAFPWKLMEDRRGGTFHSGGSDPVRLQFWSST